MAALCHALQGAGQAALALGVWGATGALGGLASAMAGLAAMSLVCALIHKGRCFEATRAAGALRMPWPARFTQMGLCVALMVVSGQALAEGLLSPAWASWVAAAFAAAAGWAAGQADGAV